MNRTALWIVVFFALGAALGGWVLTRRASSASRGAGSSESGDDDTRGVSSTHGAPAGGGDERATGGNGGEPPLPELDRAKRDALRVAIWKSLGQEAPDAAPPAKAAYVLPDLPPWSDEPGDSERGPGIEPKYIQERVRNEFFPLAQKCYGDMSERIADAGGRVVLAFDIVGNQNIGGIVEQVDVLNKSTLRDPAFIDCMRQSFLSVRFPPPEGGGTVSVEYPIDFSPDEPDE